MIERGTEERAVHDRFAKKYELGQAAVMRSIERSVCGCDYGATSWTTLAEARAIAERLALGPGKCLLDIGSGSGWPALYLAEQMGCDVTLTDLPLAGLRIAVERARDDALAGACWASVADAAALPFGEARFDAITHSDVLCCLPGKLAALQACRRVLRDQGKMIFSVLSIDPGAPQNAADLINAGSPPFIAADAPYPELLAQAGWRIAEQRDLTENYRATVAGMLGELEGHAKEIGELFGEADAANDRGRRRAMLEALDRGLVRRELFEVVPG